jgi:hypothetical protein
MIIFRNTFESLEMRKNKKMKLRMKRDLLQVFLKRFGHGQFYEGAFLEANKKYREKFKIKN